MTAITINKATAEDLETIQEVGRQTFSETFAESNSEKPMKTYLGESFSSEKVKSELNNPDSYFFIAWEEDIPVGYLKLNSGTTQTELQGRDFFGNRTYLCQEKPSRSESGTIAI
jgi:hypothetical protein